MAKHNFRGEFRVQDRITTTLSPDLQRLAHSKAIRWSDALEFGIKKLAYGEKLSNDVDFAVTMEQETEQNKVEQLKMAVVKMQEHIDVLEN